MPYFDTISFWLIIPLLMAVVLCPALVGYQVGRRRKYPDLPEHHVVTTVEAAVGLLAFVLAFTFSIAADLDDTRRALVLEEAGAIRSAWRRADVLPPDERDHVKSLIHDYLELRLKVVSELDQLPTLLTQAMAMHRDMWSICDRLLQKYPDSSTVAAFADAISNLSELHYRRVNASLHSRIPTTVWLTLGILTIVAMTGWGYQAGMAGCFRKLPSLLIMFGFATLIALILDLDRPQGGLMRVSQEALTEVHELIK